MNKNKKEVGQTIKQIRKEKGITQDVLSKKMGFKDHSAITRIETGLNDVNSETMMELAKFLEVNVGVFFTGQTPRLPEFKILPFKEQFRDDLIFMTLCAQDALKKIPILNQDLLDVQKNYLDKGDMFWLAINGRRVVGCIGYQLIDDVVTIKRFYVHPDLKRQKIGTALLDTLVKYIKEKNLNKLRIDLSQERYAEAKLFFLAHEFVEIEPNIYFKELK